MLLYFTRKINNKKNVCDSAIRAMFVFTVRPHF
jgi:hypothetical protein